jgi:hypothetical protein
LFRTESKYRPLLRQVLMEREDVEEKIAQERAQRPTPEPCAQVADGGSDGIEVAGRAG